MVLEGFRGSLQIQGFVLRVLSDMVTPAAHTLGGANLWFLVRALTLLFLVEVGIEVWALVWYVDSSLRAHGLDCGATEPGIIWSKPIPEARSCRVPAP